MDSEFMIPLGGRRIRSPPAYAALTPGTSFTLPNPTTDKRFDEDAMVSYNSLPNIDTLATGSHLSLTRSLPRLKERMANRKPVATNTWRMLWYRTTTKLKPRWTFELWESHIKQVEGHFGTAVASYFVLLRWLFYMNMAILSVWTLFVLIPQFVVEHPTETVPACIYSNASNYTYVCPRRGSTYVYRINCTAPNSTNTTLCTNRSIQATIVPKTARNIVNHTYCDVNSTFLDVWSLCPSSVTPSVQFLDLVTGRGGLSDTWLFLGHYSNRTEYSGIPYNIPVAYLVCTALVYGISFIMLIIRTGKAYTLSNVKYSPIIKANFCNKLFSAWDYKITNSQSVKLRKAFIKIEIQEELAEHQVQTTKRTLREIIHIVLIRFVTNALVIALVVGCGAAIIEATIWSWNELVKQSTDAKGLVVPILVIFFLITLPIVFHIIAHFERHKTRSGQEKITLFRSAVVWILALIIYLVAAYAAIQCTQSKDLQSTDLTVTVITKNNRTITYCRKCWETFIGQQFYNLLVLEFLFETMFIIVYEVGRNLLYRGFHKTVKNKILKSVLSKASFSISDSILSLMYYQLLMWLGFFFSPVLPLFQVIILFATFYIKKYSLMFNLEPQKDALFRASRATVVSTMTFLVVLCGSVFSVGYAVSRFHPSSVCGPFRTKATILSVISELIDSSSSGGREFLKYMSSSGFVVPLIIVLITIICVLATVIIAKTKLLQLTVTHLDTEGVQLIHIHEKALPEMIELRRVSVTSKAHK
eukprot:Em0017g411a